MNSLMSSSTSVLCFLYSYLIITRWMPHLQTSHSLHLYSKQEEREECSVLFFSGRNISPRNSFSLLLPDTFSLPTEHNCVTSNLVTRRDWESELLAKEGGFTMTGIHQVSSAVVAFQCNLKTFQKILVPKSPTKPT